MKILHITTHFYPFIGGLENIVFDLARKQAEKHEVFVLTLLYDKNLPKFEEKNGIKIYRFPCINILKNQYSLPKFGFSKKIKEIKPNVVFTHTRFFMTSFLGQKNAKNCEKIHVEHGQNFVQSKNIFIKIFARIFDEFFGKYIFKKADKIVVLGDGGRRFVKKLSGRDDDIFIIQNGIKIPEKIKKIPRKNRVIFFGRIIPEKGINEILRTAKKCQNWSFNIYGKSENKHLIKKDKSNNIRFLGEISPKEISEKIQESDLVVLPSWSEGNSLAILESAANARTIIATPVGQNEKIISSDFIVPVKNSEKIIKKLNFLENNWDMLERVGMKNFKKVKKLYSFESMLKAYEKLI